MIPNVLKIRKNEQKIQSRKKIFLCAQRKILLFVKPFKVLSKNTQLFRSAELKNDLSMSM